MNGSFDERSFMEYCDKCGRRLVVEEEDVGLYSIATGERNYLFHLKCPNKAGWHDGHFEYSYYLYGEPSE